MSAAAVGVGAASLSLIGCGDGGDGGSSAPKDQSGLLGTKEDTTKQAVAGGTWSSYRNEDVLSLNPLSNTQGAAQTELVWGHSMLMKHSLAVASRVGASGRRWCIIMGNFARCYPDHVQAASRSEAGPAHANKWPGRDFR